MDAAADINRRRFPRLNTGAEYGLHLWAAGRALEGARLQNISAVGCALQLPLQEVGSLENGSVLEPLYLDHEALPFVPLGGVVVWVLGRHTGRTSGYVLVGVEFKVITPMVQMLIQAHVMEEGGG